MSDMSSSTAIAKGTVPGALGATAVVVLGGQLEEQALREFVAYCGPTLTAVTSAAWSKLAPFLEEWLLFQYKQRQTKAWIDDPNTSSEDKKVFRQQLQELRSAYIASLGNSPSPQRSPVSATPSSTSSRTHSGDG